MGKKIYGAALLCYLFFIFAKNEKHVLNNRLYIYIFKIDLINSTSCWFFCFCKRDM